MGFIKNQFLSVIEWQETGEGVLFYKFQNQEIKKGSKLIIRPGQDAIFLYNGRVEGIFQEDGEYDIESDIIPFLTTLKSFKFAFNSPLNQGDPGEVGHEERHQSAGARTAWRHADPCVWDV